METEPLLCSASAPLSITTTIPKKKSSAPSLLSPLPEDDEISIPVTNLSPSASSLKERLIFGPSFPDDDPILILRANQQIQYASSSDANHAASLSIPTPSCPIAPSTPPPSHPSGQDAADPERQAWLWDSSSHHKSNLHRSRTAPAMSAINDVILEHHGSPPAATRPRRPSIIRLAFILLSSYLALGVILYSIFHSHLAASSKTHPVVDALYFCIVTMCTIGYGDITPATTVTKLLSIGFVIVGFGVIDVLLSGTVSYVLDLQESLLLSAVRKGKNKHDIARSYIVDVKKGRMRIRMKVGLALGVVIFCIGVGTVVLCFVEELGLLDSFYLSVMSVTTVGYGDRAFKSLPGRLFASVWLLVSTLTVARAFLYLVEARLDKRHRMMAKWVLCRDMTVSEFLAADIDHNGFVT